jgi:hypothetical protein
MSSSPLKSVDGLMQICAVSNSLRGKDLQRLAEENKLTVGTKYASEIKALLMKTTTFLRLSLLIPFLVWGICVLFFIVLSVISASSQDWDMFQANPLGGAENFFASPLWFVILTLLWGYICVGVGFGIYKILQRRGFIKDEAVTAPLPVPEPS